MFGSSSKPQRSTSPFRSKRMTSPSPAIMEEPPQRSNSPLHSRRTSPVTKSAGGRPGSSSSERERSDLSKPKENVTVTVRFRPLSARERKRGDETAWYADGNTTVRNEDNPNIAYAFDRVFGPATTTRHVYDVAAHHVVSGAMEGINGTIFAYGVTSSGKTHTMHGLQKSPGIIPLAVKDIFEIIQEMPGREFLLRVSYLEIYNEVINDLLDTTGQNLRIREDSQGTYIEGIKEEVVLSPAHALSLIATGEEHRHVGSNNFNLLSSRSHTIFTLTIESSPSGQSQGEEDVTLSQLHLIDLAGSESSKTETDGLRRKEGSYINKSLLTLGTVISKLTDGKATHIPYRDSKLTRLLQSSLSGHGRISLICTVTPASSNSEETHNTLKFAHRSKHVEIKASQNKILDEKSLIKKYQKEISNLKEELHTLKHSMSLNPPRSVSSREDLVSSKLQPEAGQVKVQSKVEEEEQAKAALMGRIQRLTKLILVSTKNTMSTSIPQKAVYGRRHSFGEDELAYLPDKKREYVNEDDDGRLDSDVPLEGCGMAKLDDEMTKENKKNKRKGMLGWFKSRKPDLVVGSSQGGDTQSSASGSPASCSTSSLNRGMVSDVKDRGRKSVTKKGDDPSVANFHSERSQANESFGNGVGGSNVPHTGTTIVDQMDHLNEQVKLLAGDVALCTGSLKRLSEQAVNNPEDSGVKEQIKKLEDVIDEKKLQIRQLEQRTIGSLEAAPQTSSAFEISQVLTKLGTQLNEKTFELEIKSADNRILEEQLQTKISENAEMQETILLLRQQLHTSVDKSFNYPEGRNISVLEAAAFHGGPNDSAEKNKGGKESPIDATTPTSVISLNRIFSQEDSKGCNDVTNSISQAAEIEHLKQENVRLAEERDGLEIHSQKLAEEAAYAKELAAAAALELQNLTEEVAKLSFQNAKLINELDSAKEARCRSECCQQLSKVKQRNNSHAGFDSRNMEYEIVEDLQNELNVRYHKEALLEAALSEKEQVERELQDRLNEAKRHEEDLKNELASIWGLIGGMKDSRDIFPDRIGTSGDRLSNTGNGVSSTKRFLSGGSEIRESIDKSTPDELKTSYLKEKRRSHELESLISRLKGEDLTGLDLKTLEELQNVHVEAITKICQAKDLTKCA